MDKSTKCCEVKAHLTNGQAVTGLFHVPARTSSAIRPSDALMEKHNGLLLLSDATIQTEQAAQTAAAVIVPFGAIAFIELPGSWTSRAQSMADDHAHAGGHEVASAPPGPPILQPKPPIGTQHAHPTPHVSKYLASRGNKG